MVSVRFLLSRRAFGVGRNDGQGRPSRGSGHEEVESKGIQGVSKRDQEGIKKGVLGKEKVQE